ncbi:hypothetical protein COCSADRAFT_271675 [Bipolaris sorokiniana ND90Pr]|uniref:Uncharacterized protein n=1 Tax=Cochliobolus sativus (strain ND90Pr / ATCC 201652) TaxID=665912 RepID=M2THZ4_COCSN|nr:uncharacterized protein COCSADRAFT_271675 [Bipolaris sorokiniana ND90Pr]EMD68327.1 hypothetical protein COCSADRAFT_271675 [Bipolaris sorokiniana ND90Pr]
MKYMIVLAAMLLAAFARCQPSTSALLGDCVAWCSDRNSTPNTIQSCLLANCNTCKLVGK